MGIKIVLSRKGMDTSVGEMASPIFIEDKKMLSLPIPILEKQSDELKCEDEEGSERQRIFKKYKIPGFDDSYSAIMDSLSKKNKDKKFHLDPIIDESLINELKGKPSFGQSDSTATLLLEKLGYENVEEFNSTEDTIIFLFFGRFRFATKEATKERYKYVSKYAYKNIFEEKYDWLKKEYCNEDLHVIWGYLIVDEIVDMSKNQNNETIIKEYSWHPHSTEFYRSKASNIIFVGKKDNTKVLDYCEKRVLTDLNRKKPLSMAVWDRNKFTAYVLKKIGEFRPKINIDEDELFLQGQWQELVLNFDEDKKECKEWLEKFGLGYLI